MDTRITKSEKYAEAAVTIIGITNTAYGRPQYILINADEGTSKQLKFPGLRFRPPQNKQTLEDIARERFEEQTGLTINMLGLRTIIPTRCRHNKHWLFRNVFLGFINDVDLSKSPDGQRQVYLADAGQGCYPREDYVTPLGESHKRTPLKWVVADNYTIARIATEILLNFNWETHTTQAYQPIPCVGARPLSDDTKRELGCGLAVSSIMLLYQERAEEPRKVILLKRKGDEHSGFAGGKIETLATEESDNLDPISCCSKEGAEEYGFPIQPLALNCCAITRLGTRDPKKEYNSIVTYSFIAEPTNPKKAAHALQNPKEHLEEKMECYDIITLDKLRDRIFQGTLRMPDMIETGKQYFKTKPGEKIPLTQIIHAGTYR